jgi:hypothetical protein
MRFTSSSNRRDRLGQIGLVLSVSGIAFLALGAILQFCLPGLLPEGDRKGWFGVALIGFGLGNACSTWSNERRGILRDRWRAYTPKDLPRTFNGSVAFQAGIGILFAIVGVILLLTK